MNFTSLHIKKERTNFPGQENVNTLVIKERRCTPVRLKRKTCKKALREKVKYIMKTYEVLKWTAKFYFLVFLTVGFLININGQMFLREKKNFN